MDLGGLQMLMGHPYAINEDVQDGQVYLIAGTYTLNRRTLDALTGTGTFDVFDDLLRATRVARTETANAFAIGRETQQPDEPARKRAISLDGTLR